MLRFQNTICFFLRHTCFISAYGFWFCCLRIFFAVYKQNPLYINYSFKFVTTCGKSMLAIKPKYLKKTSSTDPRRAIIWLIQVLKIIVDQFLKIFLETTTTETKFFYKTVILAN